MIFTKNMLAVAPKRTSWLVLFNILNSSAASCIIFNMFFLVKSTIFENNNYYCVGYLCLFSIALHHFLRLDCIMTKETTPA